MRTREFAASINSNVKAVLSYLHKHGHYFGVIPMKRHNGQLDWPDDGPARVLSLAAPYVKHVRDKGAKVAPAE